MTFISHPLRLSALTLIFTLTATSFGGAAVETAPIAPSILHNQLVARGIGKGVKVTEVDGTVVKGTLVSIDEDSFQVAPKDATQPIRILNTQVSKIGKDGMSTGAKVAIGVAIGAAIVIGFVAYALTHLKLNI